MRITIIGIGAFAYYRRIVEVIIDKILEVVTEENKKDYMNLLEQMNNRIILKLLYFIDSIYSNDSMHSLMEVFFVFIHIC